MEPVIDEIDVRDIKAILARLGGIEAAIAKQGQDLGNQIQDLGNQIQRLAVDLAELKGRVSQLPTTTTIFSYMLGLVALVVTAFGMGVGALKYFGH
jgi:hypothetical protein